MIDREAPGYAEAIRADSREHTPLGILTRGVSGIRGRTLIVNFPGNPKAIEQSWPIVEPTLKHAAATLERHRGMAAAIELEGLERRFGERVALSDVSVSVPEGADARRARRQRRRQDDAAARARRPAAPARGQRTRARRRAAPRALEAARQGGLPRARAAPLPRAHRRARTCATTLGCTACPTGAWRSCSTAVGMDARARRPASASSRRGWSSAWRPRVPCCTTRRCCCSTSRAPNLDPAGAELLEPLIGRESGRTRVLVSHDLERALGEADLALGLKQGRPGARGQGAVRVIGPARAILRKDLRIELRTKESVPAMTLFTVTVYVLFHFGLDRDTLDGSLAAGVLWVTLLLAARDRRVPPVRGRARAGRHRRPAAGAGRPHRALPREGGGAVPLPRARSSWWRCRRSPLLLLGPGLEVALPGAARAARCSPTWAWRASARSWPRSPPRPGRAS